jgi:hypothetical protein
MMALHTTQLSSAGQLAVFRWVSVGCRSGTWSTQGLAGAVPAAQSNRLHAGTEPPQALLPCLLVAGAIKAKLQCVTLGILPHQVSQEVPAPRSHFHGASSITCVTQYFSPNARVQCTWGLHVSKASCRWTWPGRAGGGPFAANGFAHVQLRPSIVEETGWRIGAVSKYVHQLVGSCCLVLGGGAGHVGGTDFAAAA